MTSKRPKEMDPGPWNPPLKVRAGQDLIDSLGSGAPGESNGEAAQVLYLLFCQGNDKLRGFAGRILQRGEDVQFKHGRQ